MKNSSVSTNFAQTLNISVWSLPMSGTYFKLWVVKNYFIFKSLHREALVLKRPAIEKSCCESLCETPGTKICDKPPPIQRISRLLDMSPIKDVFLRIFCIIFKAAVSKNTSG